MTSSPECDSFKDDDLAISSNTKDLLVLEVL